MSDVNDMEIAFIRNLDYNLNVEYTHVCNYANELMTMIQKQMVDN